MTLLPLPNALPEGTVVLDDYRIERQLGADGISIAYRALDIRADRPVVITEFMPAIWAARASDGRVGPASDEVASQYASALQRFVNDARTLARVDHHQIARVHRIGESGGTAYVVAEQVRGRSLSDEIGESGPMPEASVLAMIGGLAGGLARLHALGLLHLNISARNVMIREADGTAVLTGFGSARSHADEATRALWTTPTTGYAPLELYNPSAGKGPWTDVFALGAVAYAALTGEEPPSVVERVRTAADPDISASGRRISPELAAAVQAALAVRDSERPQDLSAWRAMLPAAARPSQEPPGIAEWRPRRQRGLSSLVIRRRSVFYVAATLVIVAGTLVTVNVARDRSLTPSELAAAAEAQLGASEETITLVEMALVAGGYHEDEPDGVMDSATRSGLKAWQASMGIPETGYLDRESVGELVTAGRDAEAAAEEARLEAERVAAAEERAEQIRQDQERQRAEAQRIENEWRAEQERLVEEQRLETERIEAERLEAQRLEDERQAEEARRREQERLAEERRQEEQRLEAERQEAEREQEEARQSAAEREQELERQAEAQRVAQARRLALARQEGDHAVLLLAASGLVSQPGELNWHASVDLVRWTGVTTVGNNIRTLDLSDRNLGGVIPGTLGSLRAVELLNLSRTGLSGDIPAELGSLRNLKALYLDGNALSGQIPPALGSLTNLEDLFLDGNTLSGPLPGELGRMTNLRRLRISEGGISGPIPAELGALAKLEVLALDGNQLNGEIPPELADLSGLRELRLQNNMLSGCIPESLGRFEREINPQRDGSVLPVCAVRQVP